MTENGHQEMIDDPDEDAVQSPVENVTHVKDAQQIAEEVVNDEEVANEHRQLDVTEHTPVDENKLKSSEEAGGGEPLKQYEELQPPSSDVSQLEGASSAENQDSSEAKSMTRKMEVPNNKVGVLIGKAGDTIKYLQHNSGARIQITRDVDADPYAGTRPVTLIGTLENIIKAEKLIKDVIAEADAGGSPSLVARGLNNVQASRFGEQLQIQVPNKKVGIIIGKSGETIKNLQTRSGARIQLIPHLPEGDQSQERTVRVTGDKKQIEMAREMINEVINQTGRSLPASSGYNQQHTSRSHGPARPHWGPRGTHLAQQGGYDYHQPGPYQSHNQQYPPQAYGNYSLPQLGPRNNSGWEQRPYGPQGGYGYYGAPDASKPIHTHTLGPSPAVGPPPSQPNYNYGQPQGAAYSQMAPPASYGQGYNENKFDNQVQNPYGIHVAPQQPSAYPQGTTPGYGQQEQYERPLSYGLPPQGPQVQSYDQPRATQPGNIPYQGPISSTQSYGQVTSTQQPSGGQMQPTYPPNTVAPGYPQQGVQPVPGYGQPGVQQASEYAQTGLTGAYVQYPSSQLGYTEQAIPNTAAAYGAYQGAGEPTYSSAPAASYGAQPLAQPTYTQPAPNQPVNDQSVNQ